VDCAIAAFWLHGMVTKAPIHQATVTETLLSLLVVVTGFLGAAMLFVGPALFRSYSWPPARWIQHEPGQDADGKL